MVLGKVSRDFVVRQILFPYFVVRRFEKFGKHCTTYSYNYLTDIRFFKLRVFRRDTFGKSSKYELTDFSIVNVRQVQFPGIVIIQTGVFSSEFKITVSRTACAWTRNQILLFKTRELRDK
jgi:hypothetical protein